MCKSMPNDSIYADAYRRDYNQNFQKNAAVFKEQLPRLIEQCPGEYVAIIDGKVVAHMFGHIELSNMMLEKFPTKFAYIGHVVQKSHKDIDMPSIE